MSKFIVIFCCLLVLSEGYEEGPDVVNGIDAKLEDRPFQASIQRYEKHFCGGSIINHYYVLTAAHCQNGVKRSKSQNVSVAAGMIDLRKPGQRRYMKTFIAHEKFDVVASFRNDIALLKVLQPFTFSAKLKPVPLPRPHTPVPANSGVVLSGWGSLGGADDEFPTILQQVSVQVYDLRDCRRRIVKDSGLEVFKTNLCTLNPQVRTGGCSGDSGGPLTMRGVLVGIVSWSIKDPYCASTVKPDVYTSVSEYIDWIKKHVS